MQTSAIKAADLIDMMNRIFTVCSNCGAKAGSSSKNQSCNHPLCKSCVDTHLWGVAKKGIRELCCPVCNVVKNEADLRAISIELVHYVKADNCHICTKRITLNELNTCICEKCNKSACRSCLNTDMVKQTSTNKRTIICHNCNHTISLPIIQKFSFSIYDTITADDCSICEARMITSNKRTLTTCKHSFCYSCTRRWIDTEVVALALSVKCPNRNCKSEICQVDIKTFHSAAFAQKLIDNNLWKCLNSMGDLINCPLCDIGCFMYNSACDDAECPNCKFKFCLKCKHISHPNETCEEYISMLSQDDKRRYEELTKSTHWLSVNSKKCPQCSTHIQRNGGCSHMTCRACKYEWCWLCMGKYIGKQTASDVCPCK